MAGPTELWIDADRSVIDKVNAEMRAASESFDRAYHRSDTWDDLDQAVSDTVRALRRVQRLARGQRAGELR